MSDLTRRTLLGTAGALALGAAVPVTAGALPQRGPVPGRRATLHRWARDTWRSMVAMTDPDSGLIADNIDGDLSEPSRNTSPTNIGGYLWSILVAQRLGFIGDREATRRANQTLETLLGMERHRPSGMYYNWYDPVDGAVLRRWPGSGDLIVPFVSSVDMGWLGAAAWAVRNSLPGARRRADRLWDDYRWDVFFDPEFVRQPGANYGGFYTEDPSAIRDPADILKRPPLGGLGGPDIYYTKNHHYDTCVSEARMVTYLGIMRGQIPGGAYYATYRTFPPDWTWQELIPQGITRTYLGVEVFNGTYSYGGQRVVPGWGGSMFEELMPDIFVPEEIWAPRSWGRNHPAHVRAQQYHGLIDAGYGYWGFSPSNNPAGGYREYGVDALGLKPDGYFSDQENTDYLRDAPPTKYGDGVVTPHASFLAMMHTPNRAIANLRKLERNFDAYGRGGFYDAIAVRSRQVSKRHLSLDQAMVLGALGNVAGDRVLQRSFATGSALRIRSVIALETFGT
ncbi:MAG: DUF3131 domain-containing protein [Micropruina sp.]|nr:DUF3131 domain-containing protein [Micropruina sp.]